MAKTRIVNTKFWDDGYIVNLDPIEKLLFLYFLTNTLTNISGIYEISTKRISYDTGVSEEVSKEILLRFKRDEKIYYIDGWIIIKNFIKNQTNNPSVQKGIKREVESLPENIWLKIKKIDSLLQALTACKSLPHTKLNLTKLNLTKLNLSEAVAEAPAMPFLEIRDYFIEKYEKRFGSKPAVDFGKDNKVVAKARQLFKAKAEWQQLIDDFMSSHKARDCGFTLAVCFSSHTINTWKAGELDKFISNKI